MSVLAVRFFHQIPPISRRSLISVNNFWSLFSIWTLDEVVRQKGDDEFFGMLNRIRVRHSEQALTSAETD